MFQTWYYAKQAREDKCLRVSVAVKRHHGHGNSYKGKHLIEAGLQFRSLVHYCQGRKHDGQQADMVPEKEQRV